MTEAHVDAVADASPRNRVERIIAIGRLIIILGCLQALRLDPSGSALLARVGSALLGVYFVYMRSV